MEEIWREDREWVIYEATATTTTERVKKKSWVG
jgi:hypothetical protein